jgi:hypothetical protein
MSDGERVLVFIDEDLNPGTGSTEVGGAERRIRAFGTAGLPELTDCHWNGSAWDNCGPLEDWSDNVTGENTHTMSFTIKYDINVTIPFNFQAVTALFNDTGAHLDFSPEAAVPTPGGTRCRSCRIWTETGCAAPTTNVRG